jgi:hypothetical protein
MRWKRLTGWDWIEPRLRFVLTESYRASANATGVRTRGIYGALGELSRRYELPPRDLTSSELRVFSQNGEDGIISEIFRRIGANTRTFVEFGIGSGIEGNCVFLADVAQWAGLFLEGDDESYATLDRKYGHTDRISTGNVYVAPDTINDLFGNHDVPEEIDILSVDVDGNDFYLWHALTCTSPRVVVIEYNGLLDPYAVLVQPYRAGLPGSTAFYGASLEALVRLGRKKGYRLVHTDLSGTNAFFVRNDTASDAFLDEAEVPRRVANYYLDNARIHQPEPPNAGWVSPQDLA